MPQTSSPHQLKKDLATELAAAWENLIVAGHKVGDLIKAVSEEEADLPALKPEVTNSIAIIAEARKTLLTLYPEFKE